MAYRYDVFVLNSMGLSVFMSEHSPLLYGGHLRHYWAWNQLSCITRAYALIVIEAVDDFISFYFLDKNIKTLSKISTCTIGLKFIINEIILEISCC